MAALPAASRLPLGIAEFSSLLQSLYAGASHSAHAHDFLGRCAEYVGAVSAAAALSDNETGQWRYFDFYPGPVDVSRVYEAHYAEADPVKLGLLRRPPRRFYLRHELCDAETIATHPYFREWYKRNGYDDVIAARVPVGEHYSCHIGFVGAAGAAHFGTRERDFLDLLLPHLEQALTIHGRVDDLKIMADLAEEQLAQTGAACVVLNDDCRIRFMNRIARQMLHEGSVLRDANGALVIGDVRAQERFSHLIRNMVNLSRLPAVLSGGMVSVPRPGAPPVSVFVMPYRAIARPDTVSITGNYAIVTLFDPSRPRVNPPRVLRELYHLTESETDVCWRLANGETLEQIAAATHSSKESVRSKLKRIFTKTGTGRQSELVRLVLIGPSMWGRLPHDLSGGEFSTT